MNFRFLSAETENKIRTLSGKFFGIGRKNSYTRFMTEAVLFIESHDVEFEKWIKDRRSMKFIENQQGLPTK